MTTKNTNLPIEKSAIAILILAIIIMVSILMANINAVHSAYNWNHGKCPNCGMAKMHIDTHFTHKALNQYVYKCDYCNYKMEINTKM